jgi:hypothetical protein
VVERARRRTVVRRVGAGIAIAVVVVLAVVVAPRALELGRSRPAVRPTPTPSVTSPGLRIPAGTYRILIWHTPRAERLGASGPWTLVIHGRPDPQGIAHMTLGRVGRDEVRSDGSLSYVDGVFVTDALSCGRGPGRYAWGLEGSKLRFSLIEDPCSLRRYVLTGGGPNTVHVWVDEKAIGR